METMEERSARERAAWEEWIRHMGMDKIWERLGSVNPFPGQTPLSLEIFASMPVWRHIFRYLGMTPERWQRLKYENFVEWSYRIEQAVETSNRLFKNPPPREELYHMDNLCYLSHPPAYLCKSDVGRTTCQMLYGKYATVEYVHVDDFTREAYWINWVITTRMVFPSTIGFWGFPRTSPSTSTRRMRSAFSVRWRSGREPPTGRSWMTG
jgi:hypothetical protein